MFTITRLLFLFPAVLVVIASGCAPSKSFVITTDPGDAEIKLDGVVRGTGRASPTLSFDTPTRTYTIAASRTGFEDALTTLNLEMQPQIALKLKPRRKSITINVQPAATVFLADKPLGEPAESFKTELVYDLGPDKTSKSRQARVTRLGYKPQLLNLDFDDAASTYTVKLQPVTKDLLLDTVPGGAKLTLDGQDIGIAPVRLKDEPFAIDLSSDQWIPRKLVATRAGYAPTALDLTFDQGQTEYRVPLKTLSKTVVVTTEPKGGTVTIGQTSSPSSRAEAATVDLGFVPLDERGTLPTYDALVTLERPGEIWEPAKLNIAWDDGKTDYLVNLKEILDRPTTVAMPVFSVRDQRWAASITRSPHMAFKDVTDAILPAAERVTNLPKETLIDSFSISPDGKSIVLSVLQPVTDANPAATRPTSRLVLVRIDGSSDALTNLTDGRHLDLMPSFTPAGDRVVFSSNRGGEMFAVWALPINGSAGATRLASGEAHLLWPTVDSESPERVFYQSLLPAQPLPRIFCTVAGTVFETDLVNVPGQQPRVGPGNDAVVFVSANAPNAPGDLFRTSDKGGIIQQLTQSADLDEKDPAWSPDGRWVVFSRKSSESNAVEVYVIDSNGGGERQLTNNPAISDRPVFDPTGEYVYFRSTRGGKLDVWRVRAGG